MKLMVIIFVFIALTKANSMTADFQFCSLECSNNGNIGDVNPTSQHASSRRLNLIQGKSGPKGMKGERGHRGMKGENGEDCDLNTIAYLKKQLGNLTDGLRNSERETNELRSIVGNQTDALRNAQSETNELRSTVEALTDALRSSEQETNELKSTIAVMTGHLRTSERETNDLRSTVGTLTENLRKSEGETNEMKNILEIITETLRPQNCSQIKEHYPESETGIHTIYKNNLKANGRQVACDMSGEGVELPTSCSDILQSDHSASNGIYKIFVEPSTITDVYCDMSDQGVQAYESCSDILQSDSSATNGIYKVVYESPSTFTNIYCDMSNQGMGIARNCSETLHFSPSSTNGIYKIFVEPSTIADVYCDMSDQGIEIPTSCSIQLQLDPLSTNGIYKIFVEPSTITDVYCDMSDQGIEIPTSCRDQLQSDPLSTNGIYKIFVEPSTITNIYCDMSDQGTERYKTCDEVLQLTPSSTNGIYRIFPNPSSSESTDVYCNMVEGGWTVFQRRFDGSTNFRRNFGEYTNGFGNKNAEYWLGLENIYQITKTGRYELYIKLRAYDQEEAFAKYSDFSIGSGSGYRLHIGTYSGTAGDSLAHNNGSMFSTFDRDQDNYSDDCSDFRGGAWWFNVCTLANLNAHLYGNRYRVNKAMFWEHFKSGTFLKETTMMLRKLN